MPINKSLTHLPPVEQGKMAKEIEKEMLRDGRERDQVGNKVSG